MRNVVKRQVQTEFAMVGFVKGDAYDLEVTRVLNQERGIDYVFGIDIPVLAKRGSDADLAEALKSLQLSREQRPPRSARPPLSCRPRVLNEERG